MSRTLPVALLVLAFTAPTLAQAAIDFDAAVSVAVGGKPEGGVLFDFDRDGDLDLAVSSDSPNKIEFFANLGNGVFAAPFALLTGNETGPEGLAAGDFNADGEPDLVVALFGTNQVRVVLGDGAGHFTLGATVAVGIEPGMIVAADFDDDGLPDAAVNNRVSGDMSVLLNDGSGGLEAAVDYPVGDETRCIATGDFDGDGQPDLAVSARDSRRVRLFRNAGGGAFELFRDLLLGSILEPQGVTFADFDSDGALDLVTATSGNELQEHPSVFLQNNGGREGIWVGPINGQTLPGVSPTGIAAADFDLDGHVDVATANAVSNNVSVNRNGGIGIFTLPVLYPVGDNPEVQVLLVGDLDGNGGPDLVALNQGSEDVSVLINNNGATVAVGPTPSAGTLALRAAPNPVITNASLTFDLPRPAEVDLAIYDVAGRLVRNLERGAFPAGTRRTTWDGRGADGTRLSAGVYVARLVAGGESRMIRLVLTR